ncbi:MAG: hypothetical protein KUG83_04805 [Gammaproteobacteria bacterium]|nr:hypothetical protein [Gammaproteobacteria bacterium]
MRLELLIFLTLVIGGTLASLLVSPSDRELALMNLKDGNLEVAEYLYTEMYQDKNSRRETLFPLTQVYTATGDIDKTILIYEEYTGQNKGDIEALAKLATLYNDAYRYYDSMHALEKLAAQQPTVERLEKLSSLYIKFNKKRKLGEVLVMLVGLDPTREKDTQMLIRLQASLGELENASQLIEAYASSRDNVPIDYLMMRLEILFSLGQSEQAIAWIKSSQFSRKQLLNMYYNTFGEGHNAFTLEVARVIYTRSQEADDLALLVQSLLGLDRTKEAIALLRPYKGGRSHLSFLYEKVLMQAWIATSSSAYENEVALIWKKRLASTDVPRKERRRLAFQLLNLGRKAEALGQFELLAQSETSSGDNVKQLLYIWGPLPGERALDWLEHRAQSAPAGDLAGWWQHLAQAGGDDRIAKMAAHRREALRPRAESIAIESFKSTGSKTRLDAYLREQIGRHSQAARLESLAEYAQNGGLTGLAASTWVKIVKQYPSNTKANYALGMNAFSKGDLLGAEQHLARYVSDASSDWEGTFYFAEALFANGRKREAGEFFEASLQKLRETGSMRKRIRMTMGLIYYRLNRSEEAMGEFDRLIKQYPNDTHLRATYSTLLIEHGKLKKAGLLLGSLSDHLQYYGRVAS